MARRIAFAATAFALLTACAVPIPTSQSGPEPAVQAYARSLLNTIQPASIAQGREICGYIYTDATGALTHTAPRAGTLDFCDYGQAPATSVASFHTHANYLPDYDSEIPSVDDARGSIDIGLDDYLATPGGRFWIIGADGVSRLICDAGCLTRDPAYRADPRLPVDNTYALTDLEALQT